MKKSFSFSLALVIILSLAILLGCAKNNNDELRQLALQWVDIWNNQDIDALIELYDEDATMMMPGETELFKGKDAIRTSENAFFIAFPDMKIEVKTILTSESEYCIEFIAKGTHTGPLATREGEIPPTGRTINVPVVVLIKVSPEGLFIEDRTYYDNMTFLAQLGLVE